MGAPSADVVDAQNAILPRIHAESRTHHLRPPALARQSGDDFMSRDSTENQDDGSFPVADETECHPCIGQGIPMVQREGLETQRLVDRIQCIFGHDAEAP